MKKVKYDEHDALTSFAIVNIAIGLINKMNKNLRQQTYLVVMFLNGTGWFVFSIKDWSNYTAFEIINNWLTEIPTFISAALLMFLIKKSHEKANKYKHLFNLYCGVNMLLGAYWLIVDIFNGATYSTETVLHWALMTNVLRSVFSYIMIAYF